MAGISGAGQTSQRVVGGSRGHVCGQGLGGGHAGVWRWRSGVAGGALDHVDDVVGLDLVCGEGIVVLHDTARVDEPLALDGDVFKVLAGEFGLEVEDRGRVGHCDGVGAVRRSLDLEGDLGIAARVCVVGHGARRRERRGCG